MCVVSMVIDHYRDKWDPPQQPWRIEPYTPWQPNTAPGTVPFPPLPPNPVTPTVEPPITDEEIKEFRKLLERARKYDKDNNEPDCEMLEKIEALKKIAKQRGVDLEPYFKE